MTIELTRGRVALVVVALAVGIAGVSYAAVPGSNGTISACKDSKGTLKVIDAEAGQTCSANQQPLTWNQQGPAGTQGAPGVSGREVVVAETGLSSEGKAYTAHCPVGKAPLGGGAWVTNDDGNMIWGATLFRSIPTNSGWGAAAFEPVPYSGQWKLIVSAICATVAP
jgi:hypothetical protein